MTGRRHKLAIAAAAAAAVSLSAAAAARPRTAATGPGKDGASPAYWLRRAKRHAGEIDNKNLRLGVLAKLTFVSHSVAGLDAALDIIKTVSDKTWREKALRALSMSESEKGNFGKAIQVAGMIDADARSLTLRNIAINYARQNKPVAAMKLAETIKNDHRDMAFVYIAIECLKWGDLAGARKALARMREANPELAACILATEVVRSGKDISKAQQKAGIDRDDLDHALFTSAIAEARKGDADQALAFVQRISGISTRLECCGRAAGALLDRKSKQAAARMIQHALSDVKQAGSKSVVVTSWLWLAEMQIKTGDAAAARESVKAAWAVHRRQKSRIFVRPHARRYIELMLDAGDAEAAAKMAAEEGKIRATLFRALFARHFAATGRENDLKRLLQACKAPTDRALTCCGAAEGLKLRQDRNRSETRPASD